MPAYTVTLADGRTATVDADEISVTAAGALVLLRGDPPPRSPVAVLAPRTWHSCFPAGASPLPPTPGTPPPAQPQRQPREMPIPPPPPDPFRRSGS